MPEKTENLVLELLRVIRGDVALIKEELAEIKQRMTSMETRLGIMQKSPDRYDIRFAHIETRIDLVDPEASGNA